MLIAIDAGHGGSDSGAVGYNGSYEKDINLKVAFKVKQRLEMYDVHTFMTRSTDVFVELQERANLANTKGADYFVSIHCNSYTNVSANGTETYVYAKKGEAYAFAQSIHTDLVSNIELTNRGIKEASFTVLTATKMPAVLVEIAFISNEREESLLIQDSFQNKVADGIVKGILDHVGITIDNRQHWGQPAIDRLLELGLITENKDPESYVIWAEFATVLLRALGEEI